MEQTCITCGSPFNYFEQTATVICDKNHVVCKACARELVKSRSKCPYCLGNINISEHSLGINKQPNQPQYWQQPQYQPYQAHAQGQGPIVSAPIHVGLPLGGSQPAYHPNYQGVQPGYQNGQPLMIVGQKRSANKFCVFSVLFLIMAIVFLVIRLRM